MFYSTLVKADGHDHYEIVEALVNKEPECDNVKLLVYAPDNASISTAVASKAKIIPAAKIVLNDILNVMMSFDTIRASGILDVPKDMHLIIPGCDRYARYVSPELFQTILYRLVYMGVRLTVISDGGQIADLTYERELTYEEAVQ